MVSGLVEIREREMGQLAYKLLLLQHVYKAKKG